MRLPITLSLYIGRHFVMSILVCLMVLLLIIGLVELLELIRRGGNVARGVPFAVILEMMLLKLPTAAEKIYPFAFLAGGMITLSRLTRSSELIVARAAGVSVWQFLAPGIVIALLLGAMFVGALNPLAAATIGRFDRLENRYLSNSPSTLTILPSGLWLRQVNSQPMQFGEQQVEEYIIHASRMDQSQLSLTKVIVFLFDREARFLGRVDADRAALSVGKWSIERALISAPGMQSNDVTAFDLPTNLTMAQIEDSFSAPETFSFWQLPGFIEVLEQAGFSALRHKLHFHSMVALPMLLAGMVMLAAVFTLRTPRRGRLGILIVAGIATGFILYFATNIIYALGASGRLPIMLAAWAPSLLVMMLASAALLHLEDG
jgi:lipopolysaccharide export system permease protein